jgi:membrane fusion protein (multidrug efflux system)
MGSPSGALGGPERLQTVVVEPVRQGSAEPAREYVGHVEPIQSVDVCAQVAGYVKATHFAEGSLVQEGDLLITIQQAQYKAEVAICEAQLAQAGADLAGARADLAASRANLDANVANEKRAEKYLARLRNADEQSIVQANLDAAESDHLQAAAAVKTSRAQIELKQARIAQIEALIQAAEAQLELARINLGFTEIRSPIAGRIGKALVTKGNYVSPTTGCLARVVQFDPIRVQFSMSDREYLATFNSHSTSNRSQWSVQVRLPNSVLYPKAGRWDYEDNEMNPSTGTISVWAEFANPDGILVPKSYATVLLDQARGPVAAIVPQEAVMNDQFGPYVFVVNDDQTVEKRRVSLGMTADGEQRVQSGLSIGDDVVTIGMQKVRQGQKVNAQESDTAPGEAR